MGNIQKTEGVKTTAPARPAGNAGSAEKPQAPATASPPRDVFSREPVPAADPNHYVKFSQIIQSIFLEILIVVNRTTDQLMSLRVFR